MDISTNNLKGEIDALGMSSESFCAIAGMASAKWSRAIRGILVLTGPEILRLSKVVEQLKQLQADAEPYQLTWKNAENIKRLLEYRRNGIHWRCVAQSVDAPADQHDQ